MAPTLNITAVGLSRAFAGPPPHRALENLDLEISPGEFLCIVGPSGCGKTTLLRILGGLDRDFAGELRLPENLRTAMIFQDPRLMPWLSALNNLLLVASPSDDQAPGRARALLEELDIVGFATAFPAQLSGGMQRRVALARALLVAPTLLLMDEPFVSVDQPTATLLRALVAKLWRHRNTTNVFVTHDLREAIALATRIVFLSSSPGRIVLNWPLDLPSQGERDAGVIERAAVSLLSAHPRILEGEAGS